MSNINLIETILGNMPTDLDDLEKMYYIYIKLCKTFSYDVRYNDSPYILAEAIKHNYQSIKNIKEMTVVCSVWAKIYMELLKKVKIKSSLINRNGHSWVEGYVNNMIIYADPTYGAYTDFARAKHNDSIHHFYPVTDEKTDKLPIMDTKSNFDIDVLNKRIGYTVNEEEVFLALEGKIANADSLKQKVDIILKNIKLNSNDYFADWQYLRNILRVLLSDFHKEIVFSTLIKINDDYTFDNKSLMVIREEDNFYYYLFNNMVNILSKEELLEYANNGYGLKTVYQDIGFEYPLQFKVPKANLHYFLNIKGIKMKNREKCYNKNR